MTPDKADTAPRGSWGRTLLRRDDVMAALKELLNDDAKGAEETGRNVGITEARETVWDLPATVEPVEEAEDDDVERDRAGEEAVCAHCGEPIERIDADHAWFHLDGHTGCKDMVGQAEPPRPAAPSRALRSQFAWLLEDAGYVTQGVDGLPRADLVERLAEAAQRAGWYFVRHEYKWPSGDRG